MLEGLHPNRPTHVLRFETDERTARTMTDLIGEMFDAAETAVAAFEAEDGRTWRLEAYFSEEPDEAGLREALRPVIGDAAEGGRLERLDSKDWISASLEGLHPVRAGRFVVHGQHDRARVKPHEIGLEIEAALAFGTGHHGTTRGCLLALADELRRRRPRYVLDIGTGTGVLALAAAAALRTTVVAGDLDPEAVRVARENARLNGLHGLVRFYEGPGIRHALASRPGRFDLVFANILARPLMRLAPAIAGVLARNGTLVLSGLLVRDVPGVLSTYAAQGLRLKRRGVLEGWATLVLVRGGAAPRPRRAASGA